MKTRLSSRAGFIQLTLIFACIILLLFAMGAQGIYSALKNRHPAAMSCEEFARTKPRATWLAITNCVLDLQDASYGTLIYQNVEVPTELYIPVRSANAREQTKDHVLLMTRDPELMKLLREMESQASKADLDLWLARNTDRLHVRREVKGLVQFGVDLNAKARRKLARLQDNLAPDFIILEEGKEPELTRSMGYFALGGMLLTIGIVTVKRTRKEPDPGETY